MSWSSYLLVELQLVDVNLVIIVNEK